MKFVYGISQYFGINVNMFIKTEFSLFIYFSNISMWKFVFTELKYRDSYVWW